MFTGLVEGTCRVVEPRADGPGMRLIVESAAIAEGSRIGDSIALNGCCLTVVQQEPGRLHFDLGPETLQRTMLGRVQQDQLLNWERSLRVGDRLGGHFVTGHVDTTAVLERRLDDREWSTFWFRLPDAWTRQMVPKGSITVDGVSLTLVEVESQRFSVCLIPHTLAITTLGRLKLDDTVNIETDLLAKYVEKQLAGFRA
jgi:riboflavin synthase